MYLVRWFNDRYPPSECIDISIDPRSPSLYAPAKYSAVIIPFIIALEYCSLCGIQRLSISNIARNNVIN